MEVALCHYHIYKSRDESRNPMLTDWFRFNVSIVYRSSIHSNSTSYEKFCFVDIPIVVCKSFFTREGHNFLRSHLLPVRYFTPELLEKIIPPIASWVRGLFKLTDNNDPGHANAMGLQPHVFPLNLDIEFELPCDQCEGETTKESIGMQQVKSIISPSENANATASPQTEYCTICLGECRWCDGDNM
ncbi:uncharacterized protein LOC113859939 [Abrus precatorius]|uniref:Uncharacterized protein LOC113859939 n=1 Tax=Abrus precatorius TaxID=3816 RepID=A0A8B8L181_ABRPR|nr:uncharacterized protein LOC113859939 [Abrus precatorius]